MIFLSTYHYILKAQVSLTQFAGVSARTSANQTSESQVGHQKMQNMQLVTTCEKLGLRDLPSLTQELGASGRERIQFSRSAVNCLNHETMLALSATPCFIHNIPSNF